MSYARWGADGSEVYVTEHVDGFWRCYVCHLLGKAKNHDAKTPGEMAAHLREHVAAGHCVPQSAIDELDAEERKPCPHELEIPDNQPAPQRRTDPVRPRRVMLPDSLGVPRSLRGAKQREDEPAEIREERPIRTGGWQWR